MGNVLLSNPPYNLKWESPSMAGFDQRFMGYGVPPKNNANYAFILTGVNLAGKSCFLLPLSVLSPKQVESDIMKELVSDNHLEAVVLLPGDMFESTSIPVCILSFNKNKSTTKVVFVDAREMAEKEIREQRGQFGGASHEGRVYKKEVNVLSDETIDKIDVIIRNCEDIEGISKCVSIDTIASKGYSIRPQDYITPAEVEEMHRSYKDIASDYNSIIQNKNALKITINETLAKTLGLYNAYANKKEIDIGKSFEVVGEKAEKEDYISFTKSAIFKVECRSDKVFPEVLGIFVSMWKQHMMFLNNEENKVLAEFRDALLPDLMQGKIQIEQEG